MKLRLSVRWLAPLVVALAFALNLPRIIGGDASLPSWAPPARLEAIGSFAKLGSLLLGAVFGLRVAARLEKGNPARLAWLLLGLWLACFAAGQAALMSYTLFLGREAPLPSLGDAGFLTGYALMLVAAWRFVFVYRASGFPVGSARQHAAIALGAALVLTAVAVPLLAPIAAAEVPLRERMINLAYPILDLAALVPTLVMLRITRAFRGGKVWAAWAALLFGFVLMTGGDILFAYFSSAKMTSFAPGIDLMFLLGYFFAASGTMLQHEMVRD
jgi:hypothetical protein